MAEINLQEFLSKLSNLYFTALRTAQDKLRLAPSAGVFFSVFLLGFTGARFAVSLLGYTVFASAGNRPVVSTPVTDASRSRASLASFDLASIIDGVFFKRAVVESAGIPAQEDISARNFSLIGTLEGDKTFARAVIRLQGTNEEPKEYAIGEKIGSAVLLAIGYEKIWIRANGQKIKIEVGQEIKDTAQPGIPPGTEAATQTKILSRQEINEKILGNPAAIYGKGASFGPHLVNGKIEGFKLHRIPEGHVFQTLGARSGDIIRSINGHQLGNTGQMMEIWNNIKTMPRVSVDLIRDGKPMKFDFEIRN